MSSERKARTPAKIIEDHAFKRETIRKHLNCAKCHHAYLLSKICARLNRLGRKSEQDWKFAKELQNRLWRRSKYFRYWKELADKGLSQEKIEERFKVRGWDP